MTPQQIDLVQSSFKKVVPIAGTAADLFYDRLFEIAPEVRSMFPQDLGEQKKKLMAMLGTAVGNLHKLETILPAVKDLGSRHKGYGVTAEHSAPVGAALLWNLEKGPRASGPLMIMSGPEARGPSMTTEPRSCSPPGRRPVPSRGGVSRP